MPNPNPYDFPALINQVRNTLGETQSIFGKRFKVSHVAVSDWEAGKSEAPYRVLSFCLQQDMSNPNKRAWTIEELKSIYQDSPNLCLDDFVGYLENVSSQSTTDTKEEPSWPKCNCRYTSDGNSITTWCDTHREAKSSPTEQPKKECKHNWVDEVLPHPLHRQACVKCKIERDIPPQSKTQASLPEIQKLRGELGSGHYHEDVSDKVNELVGRVNKLTKLVNKEE
jgi:hypothetical protein